MGVYVDAASADVNADHGVRGGFTTVVYAT